MRNDEIIIVSPSKQEIIIKQYFQEKRWEMQVRSAKTVYLHLCRSPLNFSAFLAHTFLALNLLL
jgi:hypothetical protein